MSVKTFLDHVGSDVVKVFAWIGSPAGRTAVGAGEAVVEDVFPAATGIVNLLNSWVAEAIKTQALATAAGAQQGSSTQKAAATINAIMPQLLSFAQQEGLPAPDAATIAKINNNVVEILNSLAPPTTAAPKA